MRANSLGFATEIVKAPQRSVSYCEDVEVPPQRRCMTRNACLCISLVSALVASAVGVGIWFAVTES